MLGCGGMMNKGVALCTALGAIAFAAGTAHSGSQTRHSAAEADWRTAAQEDVEADRGSALEFSKQVRDAEGHVLDAPPLFGWIGGWARRGSNRL
jgi:hypothetical protein